MAQPGHRRPGPYFPPQNQPLMPAIPVHKTYKAKPMKKSFTSIPPPNGIDFSKPPPSFPISKPPSFVDLNTIDFDKLKDSLKRVESLVKCNRCNKLIEKENLRRHKLDHLEKEEEERNAGLWFSGHSNWSSFNMALKEAKCKPTVSLTKKEQEWVKKWTLE